MANKTSVRQMLNERGIDNNRIGWNNGTVTVDNQNFMKPTNVYQGTSYADQPTFNQAFSTYQNALQPQQTQQSPYQGNIFTPAETDMTWQQRIPYYAQNPQAGQAEVQRAQQALGVYKAMGDTAKAQAAERWLGTLGNVVSQPSNPQDAQIQQLMDQLMGQSQQPRVNPQDAQIQQLINSLMAQATTREPFDPYTSPEFAAQEARSQRAAQEGIRASQEALGTAGFGRSTVLGERAQGIQNEQEDFLRTQVIPQIIAQNEARRQQELQNQMAMLDPMMQQQGVMDTRTQQELQNQMAMLSPLMQQQGVMDERQRFEQQFGYQKERDIAGDIQFQQQFDYQKARDAIEDEKYKLEFDEDVRRYGEQFALDKAIKQGQLNVSRYSAQTSRMGTEQSIAQQNLGNLYKQWETTGTAPTGIPGVAKGSKFPKAGDPNYFEAQIISGLTQFDNVEDALGWVSANSQAITEELGAKGYANMRKAAQSQFTTGASQDIRNRALSMAQNDNYRWNQAKTPEQREQLIREYEELLRVQ